MKEQYWIYVAQNGERYIQTHNKYLASGVLYLTDVPFYKITINDRLIYSFQYSEDLENTFQMFYNLRTKHKLR